MLITSSRMIMEWFLVGFITVIACIAIALHRIHAAVDCGIHHAPFNSYTASAIIAGRMVTITIMACSSIHAMARARLVFDRRAELISVARRD